MVTKQVVRLVESHPDQVENEEVPLLGVAIRVTAVPTAKLLLHTEGQVMPEGELVTVPPTPPPIVTVRFASCEQLGLPFSRISKSADA